MLPNRQWDALFIQELVPLDIAKAICSLFISASKQMDKLVWGLSADGVYSVKTGALLAYGLLPFSVGGCQFSLDLEFECFPKN